MQMLLQALCNVAFILLNVSHSLQTQMLLKVLSNVAFIL